ncbi:hypothetical protein [Piscinibacter sp. HJYY11]|uniref:hypothetical protein n=1 Tax=Piscinibacter sp. HJYY11 TaxID=2801333 RepID=UPI00191D0D78|nr:hypothetical protein [Piscinibacter sp. HJYY11]MBL0729404.1 hypothetical protein [Piscinibacter sp. HJYY11]
MQRNQVAGAVGLVAASMTPNADLEQTYYLGSFDPQGQVPPAVYRIRVRGQSSLLSNVRFASSWVPAEVVDALTGAIEINPKDGRLDVKNDGGGVTGIANGRGLVMFGPEGFREAPRNHRLVIVMGSSPETVDQAFSSALGTVAKVRAGESTVGFDKGIVDLLASLGDEKLRLRALVRESEP